MASSSLARLKAGLLRSKPEPNPKQTAKTKKDNTAEYESVEDRFEKKRKSKIEDYVRLSRSYSDLDIPGTLVISSQLGLFSMDNGGKKPSKGKFEQKVKPECSSTEGRAVFYEPDADKFQDIRSRFSQAAKVDDLFKEQQTEEFLNPLHKGNKRRKLPNPVKINSDTPVIPHFDSTDKQDVFEDTKSSPLTAQKQLTPKPSPPSKPFKPSPPPKPSIAPKPSLAIKPAISPKPTLKPKPSLQEIKQKEIRVTNSDKESNQTVLDPETTTEKPCPPPRNRKKKIIKNEAYTSLRPSLVTYLDKETISSKYLPSHTQEVQVTQKHDQHADLYSPAEEKCESDLNQLGSASKGTVFYLSIDKEKFDDFSVQEIKCETGHEYDDVECSDVHVYDDVECREVHEYDDVEQSEKPCEDAIDKKYQIMEDSKENQDGSLECQAKDSICDGTQKKYPHPYENVLENPSSKTNPYENVELSNGPSESPKPVYPYENVELKHEDPYDVVANSDDSDGWDSDEFDDEDDDNATLGEDRNKKQELDLVFPDARSKKLYNIAHEILTTERAYVKRLRLLDKVFFARLDTECCAPGLITPEVMQDIFANIGSIHKFHSDFLLPKLEERMAQWTTNNTLGDILKTLAPFLKMYSAYVGNFDKANETVSVWLKKLPKFASVINEIQRSPESENLTLQHHMLEPIQRVPRYKLLLTDYINKLPEDSPDVNATKDALAIVSKAAQQSNEIMKKTERFQKLLEIQERLLEQSDIITPSREFVKEGVIRKVSARKHVGQQDRYLILFNDKLLCCSKFPTGKLKMRITMDVDGMAVGDAGEDIDEPNTFRITSKQRVVDFSAETEDEKEQWIKAVSDVIAEWKRKMESYKRVNEEKDSTVRDSLRDNELGTKAPAWIRDESVTMCMLCDALFTLTRRRHHCRACGGIYCNACSHNKAPLEYRDGKLCRVCRSCREILVHGVKKTPIEQKTASIDTRRLAVKDKVLLSGFLEYRGSVEKHWVKRWCVLSDNFVFYSYKARKDTKAAFSLPLPGYTVDQPNLADSIEKKMVIKLHHKNVVVHFFAAENENSLKRWTHHLSYAVKAETIPEDITEPLDNKQRSESCLSNQSDDKQRSDSNLSSQSDEK